MTEPTQHAESVRRKAARKVVRETLYEVCGWYTDVAYIARRIVTRLENADLLVSLDHAGWGPRCSGCGEYEGFCYCAQSDGVVDGE